MNNSPLEFLARQYGNVVKYDADGNPSIFVKFPKMKSKDLDASLPDHTHPAFIIDGVEQDYILIGKYKASEINKDDNGTLYSLPNVPARVYLGADQLLERMRAANTGASGMTIADGGFLLLLAQKNGWNPQKGNNSYGIDYRDATTWETAKSVAVGNVRAYHGWTYKCLIAHTTSVELNPIDNPLYWQKEKQIGGVGDVGGIDPETSRIRTTINGSGPLDWFLGSDPASVCDLVGSCYEANYGYRLVNCELQIMENNNAASPNADLSASSAAWKAILPNTSNDGYTLVAPGTPGTLHWTWANGKITLDTVEPEFDNEYRGTNFKDLAVNTTHIPHIPHIIRELGLFPTQGSTMAGYYYVHMTRDERFPRRGGTYSNPSNAGLGYVDCRNPRSNSGLYYGARPRSL